MDLCGFVIFYCYLFKYHVIFVLHTFPIPIFIFVGMYDKRAHTQRDKSMKKVDAKMI